MAGRPAEAITWLGHATCVLDVAGARLVTDPLLGEHAGILRRRGGRAPQVSDWTGSDAVLVSHLHHDHAHAASLRSTGAPALMAPANTLWANRRDVPAIGLRPNQWWSPPGTPSVRVRVAPAVHGHRPMPHRPNAANGFLVVRDGDAGPGATGGDCPRDGSGGAMDGGGGEVAPLRIWFAGDTELYPNMSRLPELAGGPIDVALVPIGGWGPRLSGGHMDPSQAAMACALVGARRAIPIHWGTLHAPFGRNLPRGWMDHGGDAFAAALRRAAPECTAVVLSPGQRLPL